MKLTHLTPVLNVSDVPASLDWFEALGWERGFAWDDEGGMHSSTPTFASVQAGDDAEIFLCLDNQGARPMWMSWFLSTRDALDAVARAVELGYEIAQEPIDESWGMREFHLRHPDGHVFRVSSESG